MKEVMTVVDAMQTLNLEELPETIKEVIEVTRQKWQQGLLREEITDARMSIIREMVQKQMAERRYFEISDVENACPKCHGTGELYQFHVKSVNVRCHICGGRGSKKIKCPSCDNGRYINEMAGGGIKINVQCNKCHGEGERFVKCDTCRGKGVLRKIVKDSTLKNTTHCIHCHGLGFIKPIEPEIEPVVEKAINHMRKEQSLLNPVIDEETRQKLLDSVR